MPEMGVITSTIRRGRGMIPEMPLVNMFFERAPTEPREFALQSFPGLSDQGTTLGSGPVYSMFKKDGILSGVLCAISGNSLYVNSSNVGAVNVARAGSIAGNEMGIVAAAGDDAVFFDGMAFSVVDFPDNADVSKVMEHGGRFLFLREDTQAFYWTAPLGDMLDGDGEIIVDGLDYASAESEPDRLLDGLVIEDTIILGGSNSIEYWTKTGDVDLPYIPIQGRTFQKGVRATGCMATFDNSFAWVSPENIVYRAGNVPERISDSGIEELIAGSLTCRTDTYFFEGHEFLKIGLDSLTIEYDAQSGQWNERRTGTRPFRGGPVVSGPLFGSNINGNIYQMTGRLDLFGYQERSFCAGVQMTGGAAVIDNVLLRTNPGSTEYLEGDYTDPIVELIQSFDGGRTFSEPLQEHLGEQGQYRREVEWRALGFADPPGLFIKFRVSDPVDFRVSGALFNEAHGGRSR